jgi:hypothetical protein
MRRRSLLAAAAAACASPLGPTACSGDAAKHNVSHSPGEAPALLDALSRDYEALMTEHGYHEWARYAGEAQSGNEAARMESLRKREQQVVLAAHKACQRAEGAQPPIEQREADLWARAAQGLSLLADPQSAQLSDQLERIINDHAFMVDGRRVGRGDLRKMARSDDPAARRAQHRAWGALHREAAPTARSLLKRRHELGLRQSNAGFYATLLRLRGLEPAQLTRLLTELSKGTQNAYESTLAEAKKAAGLQQVAPWDLEHLAEKLGASSDARFPAARALPFARQAWAALGVDLDNPKIRIDVRDFAFGGQTISLRVPDDVRTVVSPSPGARFYATLMHELGHAFAATRNRERRPVYKGYEWVPGLTEPACDEGVAEVFGRLIDEPEALARFLPDMPEPERLAFVKLRARSELLSARQRLVFIAFEHAALEDPDQDLDELHSRLERELLGVTAPPDAEPTWARSPFLATYPVYTQSYVLAAMLSCQVRRSLRARLGATWTKPEAGELLAQQLVGDGARTTTDEKLQRLTGGPLASDAYLAWLTGLRPDTLTGC